MLAGLDSDAARGLAAEEARARLARFGPNRLAVSRPVPGWRRFLGQFASALVLLLLAAALLSAGLWLLERDTPWPFESLAILAIVLLNAILGHVQQGRAERALAELARAAAARARVVRDGAETLIAAEALVPGDVVLLEEGDLVPADARLLTAAGLLVDESALTGESLPVEKDATAPPREPGLAGQTTMLFAGTAVRRGRARAVVTATGMATEIGRIAGMLAAAPPTSTPLQRELDRLGRRLGLLVIAIALVLVGLLLATAPALGPRTVFDALILGVALAVAAVPEGLPAVVTAVLAAGVQRMAARHAIVRRLAAVETLGACDVIATDKTGTLTRNAMTLRVLVTAAGPARFAEATGGGVQPPAGVDAAQRAELLAALTAAERASNATLRQAPDGRWQVLGDPTEGALVLGARGAGLEAASLDREWPRRAEIPFTSERRLMTTVNGAPGRLRAFAKGAPERLLACCTEERVGEGRRPLTPARRAAILAESEALAAAALRPLGLAERPLPADRGPAEAAGRGAEGGWGAEVEHGMVFLGLAGLMDPPRPEAAAAVARARAAGIRPLMITGDHPRTAAAIAAEIGLDDSGRVLTGPEIAAMDEAALERAVGAVAVYARVEPAHKLRIVQALRRRGAIVAMTGDGINDAPALKSADIGIAMGDGTDVAKQSADMVLLDNDFSTIVAAIAEGRAIFANIRKFLLYMLSSNLGEVATMAAAVLLAGPLGLVGADGSVMAPLLATQILWINLVTDGAPALALGLDPAAPDIMRRRPRPRGEGVITPGMLATAAGVGLMMAAGTLIVIDAALPGGLIEGTGGIGRARTLAFTTLTLFQIVNVLNVHAGRDSTLRRLGGNRLLWAAIGLSLLLQVAVLEVPALRPAFGTEPLDGRDWLLAAAAASTLLWLHELRWLLLPRGRARPG